MNKINHVKAYLLGLLIGSGKIDKDVFVIDLPFKKWGMNPQRMNIIAIDILTRICDYFKTSYQINVTYEIGNSKWFIKPMPGANINAVVSDLLALGLPTSGFLLNKVDLTVAKGILNGVQVESFLSGIFDARASLTLSHRRFSNVAPVVSIEIPGSTKNFKFVVQLCSWLTELGSVTDQILYNHPNQHSSSDPDYMGWKKGFKIRFLVKSFLAKYSFALQAKAIDITKIEKSQTKREQTPCILRSLRKPNPVTIHVDQNSNQLPIEVRNKVFFHYHHICAIMGCPFAPVKEVEKIVAQYKSLITFFPRLAKGNSNDLLNKFNAMRDEYFPSKSISKLKYNVQSILSTEVFENFVGLDQGIAFLFSPSLHGKRHVGAMKKIIEGNMRREVTIYTLNDDFDSPLLIINKANDRAFICSAINNSLNQELIKRKIRIKNLNVSII